MTGSKKSLGLYIHIPFCIKKCLYCDFCSLPRSMGADMSAYCSELCRRIALESEKCKGHTVDTVYFGGGTPTLLPIECFSEIMKCIFSNYDVSADAEISCECNPASCDGKYLSSLRALGINRLSIGLQSIHEDELAALGRAHSFSDFCDIFRAARNAGFDNISVDLMYGIPNQTLKSFGESLETLVALCPEHISAYGLKIEDGTPFALMRDSLVLPDEDTEFEMYMLLTNFLAKNGYAKYEISNFSKPCKESRHNLRYWQRKDYIGFGVAAHSCFGGERYGNSRDIVAFMRGEDITSERTLLNVTDERNEYLMLGLRLSSGIDLVDFRSRFGYEISDVCPDLKKWISGGLMTLDGGRLSFTEGGFFVSNAILSELIDTN